MQRDAKDRVTRLLRVNGVKFIVYVVVLGIKDPAFKAECDPELTDPSELSPLRSKCFT